MTWLKVENKDGDVIITGNGRNYEILGLIEIARIKVTSRIVDAEQELKDKEENDA